MNFRQIKLKVELNMRYLTLKQRVVILISCITINCILILIVLSLGEVKNAEIAYGLKGSQTVVEVVKGNYTPLHLNVCDSDIKAVESTSKYNLTDKELELLYAITWAEAGNEPFEGQVAVANVILNRVDAHTHPDTLKKVVYEGNGSQFNAIRRTSFGYYTPETVEAVHTALNSPIFDNDVVYFANVKLSTNRGFIDRTIIKNKVTKIGGHTFASEPKIKKEE
jgi:N-acetylmuramoyl-L-alanine amidase